MDKKKNVLVTCFNKLQFIMQNLFLFIFFSIVVSLNSIAQVSVKLTLQNNKFKQAYFCSEFGQKLNVITTSNFIGDVVQFKSNNNLTKGMYMIFLDDSSKIEIIIDHDSEIILKTKYPHLTDSMEVLKGNENKTYYMFIQYKNSQIKNLNNIIESIKEKSKNKQNAQSLERINFLKGSVTYKIKNYSDSIINIDTNLFISKIIKASLIPNLNLYLLSHPSENKYDNDIEFLLTHFFDNIDFTDSLLLNTAFVFNSINYYIEKIVIPRNAIGFNYANEFILKKARTNNNMYNYVLPLLINLYEKTQLEEVYVKLYDDYLFKNHGILKTEKFTEITKKTNIIKSLKIGSIAPNIVGIDSTGNEIKLSSVKSNMILLMLWSSNTKHINETFKQLTEINNKYKEFGIQIFTVSLDTNITKWKTFLKKQQCNWINVTCKQNNSLTGIYNTWALPSLYVLDNKLSIAAKPVNVDYVKKEFEKTFKK